MSVVACREIIDGRGATQRFAESVKCKRTFTVTVDDPTTSVSEMAASANIKWLDQHPEFPAVYVTDISCSNDGDPQHYKLEFTYDLLKPEAREAGPTAMPWQRPDKFSFSGGLTNVPAIVHYNNGFGTPQLIVNSAGDPLEGATRDQAEWKVQISGSRQYFPKALAMACINAVNSDSWSGFDPGTLKVQAITGGREIEQVNNMEVPYWSVSVEIAYRPEGWLLRLWDVGYNEVVPTYILGVQTGSERRRILDKLMEPVSDPVALSGGQAKTAGQPPDILTFALYREVAFTGLFSPLPS